nr:hypothetical protein [Streptomyces xanthophaeus]
MAGEAGEAFVIGQAVVQELGGNGPLGEVEETLSARAAGGGEFPGPDHELHRRLGGRVPFAEVAVALGTSEKAARRYVTEFLHP